MRNYEKMTDEELNTEILQEEDGLLIYRKTVLEFLYRISARLTAIQKKLDELDAS